MEWMLLPLRRYATTSGRSRRKEYWMFYLFFILGSAILAAIDDAAGLVRNDTGVLSGIFGLATLVPGVAVTVRRLHDTDRSGWWILAPLGAMIAGVALMAVNVWVGMAVLIAGVAVTGIALLVFLCQDGTHGDNRFGPDPKGPDDQGLSEIFA